MKLKRISPLPLLLVLCFLLAACSEANQVFGAKNTGNSAPSGSILYLEHSYYTGTEDGTLLYRVQPVGDSLKAGRIYEDTFVWSVPFTAEMEASILAVFDDNDAWKHDGFDNSEEAWEGWSFTLRIVFDDGDEFGVKCLGENPEELNEVNRGLLIIWEGLAPADGTG